MKRLVTLGALIAALAAAGPAAADGTGQSARGSLGTVQVGGLNASPSTAVSAPVTAGTPVSVASRGTGSSTSSSSQGATASSNTGGNTGTTGQSAQRSIGTVQVGSAHVAPATSVNAPVNVNTPISAASRGTGGTTNTSTGGATASNNNSNGSTGSDQSASRSVGTVQAGSAHVAPATSVNAPINANAPVAVLSRGGNESTNGSSDNGATSSGSPPAGGTSDQSAQRSIGTVQVGSIGIAPATSLNTPMNANAPVSVLSESGESSPGSSTNGGSAATSGASGSPGTGTDQSASRSVGTVQAGSANAAPATAGNAPVNAGTPVTAAPGSCQNCGSDCGGSCSTPPSVCGASCDRGSTAPDGGTPNEADPCEPAETRPWKLLRLRLLAGLALRRSIGPAVSLATRATTYVSSRLTHASAAPCGAAHTGVTTVASIVWGDRTGGPHVAGSVLHGSLLTARANGAVKTAASVPALATATAGRLAGGLRVVVPAPASIGLCI